MMKLYKMTTSLDGHYRTHFVERRAKDGKLDLLYELSTMRPDVEMESIDVWDCNLARRAGGFGRTVGPDLDKLTDIALEQ